MAAEYVALEDLDRALSHVSAAELLARDPQLIVEVTAEIRRVAHEGAKIEWRIWFGSTLGSTDYWHEWECICAQPCEGLPIIERLAREGGW